MLCMYSINGSQIVSVKCMAHEFVTYIIELHYCLKWVVWMLKQGSKRNQMKALSAVAWIETPFKQQMDQSTSPTQVHTHSSWKTDVTTLLDYHLPQNVPYGDTHKHTFKNLTKVPQSPSFMIVLYRGSGSAPLLFSLHHPTRRKVSL